MKDIKETIAEELKEVEMPMIVDKDNIKNYIYEIRGKKVMLDYDLARIYGYETKNFNRQVKNNLEKFDGEDFMFQLTETEMDNLLRSKKSTTKIEQEDGRGGRRYMFSRSQFVTMNRSPQRGENIKHSPYAFTEQGVYMLTMKEGEKNYERH